MYLGVIGARFGDAGMKDVDIQSNVVAGGSIDAVLRGKNYNWAVTAHKISWETLWCLLLEKFEFECGMWEILNNIFFRSHRQLLCPT